MSFQKTTFFSKNAIVCPCCDCTFYKEELQTGRGRLNAGDLTEELRRQYIPTQKFGLVNPLLYPIVVCPECLFAGLVSDFTKNPQVNYTEALFEKDNRKNLMLGIFGLVPDFTKNRDLISGTASYLLAFASTIHLYKSDSPTARRGLYSLRAAWLTDDLYKSSNLDHFKHLSSEMYYQAYLAYDRALELQIHNIEPFDGFRWMGPDIDTNYGYDGMLYIMAYLAIKHSDLLPPAEQIVKIGQSKRVLSKIFGVGKSNKNKPRILVSNARNYYGVASEMLKKLETEGFDTSVADQIEQEEDEQ